MKTALSLSLALAVVVVVSVASPARASGADQIVTYQDSVQPIVNDLRVKQAELSAALNTRPIDSARVESLSAEIGVLRGRLAVMEANADVVDDGVVYTGRHGGGYWNGRMMDDSGYAHHGGGHWRGGRGRGGRGWGCGW